MKNQVYLLILKKILILNSFSFEDKDPRFTRLKPGLALRLISKGLFYIRAMVMPMDKAVSRISVFPCFFNSTYRLLDKTQREFYFGIWHSIHQRYNMTPCFHVAQMYDTRCIKGSLVQCSFQSKHMHPIDLCSLFFKC